MYIAGRFLFVCKDKEIGQYDMKNNYNICI